MSKINSIRSGCKDVFHAFLVKNATYDTKLEIPCLRPENMVPEKLIPFSKAIGSKEYDCWVHFYEDDVAFERIWNKPNKYLPILGKFKGVITPDFSIYRDMPLVMQHWNIYRSRAIGHWLQENGIRVIPNIRFGDERTYEISCAGIEKHSVVSVGSHGCMKLLSERRIFKEGLNHIINNLEPKMIVVYGTTPDEVFNQCKVAGIEIIQFDSAYMQSKKAVSA